MAWVSGTATNYDDLITKLRDFLTSNAALVAAGQNWTVVTGPATGTPFTRNDEVLLKGPGASGTDEILVALMPEVNVAGDYYNLGISGLSSYNPALPISGQPNRLLERFVHLWDSAMPYWFIANGRRFIIVVRVTSVYQSAYAGFILPYHLPSTWAYPLFIGGCSADPTGRYSVVTGRHSAFFNPGGDNSSPPPLNVCGAAIRLPDGQWIGIANKYHSGTSEQDTNRVNVGPWAEHLRPAGGNLRDTLDGQYAIFPSEITIEVPYPANLGSLEGVWYVPGFGTASENTITVDGTSHLIVQNVHRTSNNEYAAIALE